MSTDDSRTIRDNSYSYLDQLLNKYVSVWLWSILFGTTTGILYSFLSFRFQNWGPLGVILVAPAFIALLSAMASGLCLYTALTRYLLPRFISNEPDAPDPDPKYFGYQIRRAFLYFIYAALFRALASLLEIAFASTGRFN